MTPIQINKSLILETLTELQNGGKSNCERVVLWLGPQDAQPCKVVEVYVPEQYAESDYFRIPRESIAKLIRRLRKTNQYIVAQVHSHPHEAFHSYADDRWAIVRHVGALSLVLPYFASQTTINSFITDLALFELSAENKWSEVNTGSVGNYFSII